MYPFLPFLTPSAMRGERIQQHLAPVANLSQYINPSANMKAKMAIESHFSKNFGLAHWDTYKTVMCQTWLETANCRFGPNCRFAHGEEELRHVDSKPRLANNPLYKTRPCEKFVKNGICPYGPRCLFIHPEFSSNPSVFMPLENVGLALPAQITPAFANSMPSADCAQFSKWKKPESTQPKAFVPISSIWSSDECGASGTTSTSRGSPSDFASGPFSNAAGGCKPEPEDCKKEKFNDSAGCLTELRDELAGGLLLDNN